MTHEETAKLIDQYHRTAELIYGTSNIKIAQTKNVQLCEEGAFVEAMIWIPKEVLEYVKAHPNLMDKKI